jgi:ubiquinone/menaquinone biosynthesis C-methylase UbiE
LHTGILEETVTAYATQSRITETVKQEIQSIYNDIAGEYDERIPGAGPADDMFTATEIDFLLGKIQPEERVLDIGCGTGRFTVPLAELGTDVSALDISTGMLEVLRGKLDAKGLSADLRQGDMAHMPFPDNSFDAVTSFLALMHIPLADRPAVFREVSRVLKPGGRMILGVKNGIFERLFTGDRFAAIDVTDVDAKKLLFTKTSNGTDYEAAWYSFTPQELDALFARVGMTVTHLKGNIPFAVWLANEVLQDPRAATLVQTLEHVVADIPPFNYLGYHLLVEAVKPEV